MPIAHQGEVKYHYRDHDTDRVSEAPPVQNQWYTVFDAEDVRLLWCRTTQTNDETAAKDVEVRWTIDGNVYLSTTSMDDNTDYFTYRVAGPSAVGTAGLNSATPARHGTDKIDKRGLSFKVEVRITSVPGTNQTLVCDCVRETLEET